MLINSSSNYKDFNNDCCKKLHEVCSALKQQKSRHGVHPTPKILDNGLSMINSNQISQKYAYMHNALMDHFGIVLSVL